MKRLGIVVLMACAVGTARAEHYTAKVIAVLDGDTVLVLREGGGQKQKVRLANIDAPEVGHGGQPPNSQLAQPYGVQSRDSLVGMVARKQVQIDSQAVDQYGRVVAVVRVDGRNVNEEQVRRGMAWEYSHYHSDRSYIALQHEAQQAHRGLWQDGSPLAPWQWRKSHLGGQPAFHAPTARQRDKPTVLYDVSCGHKTRCAQMSSCDEAHFYLTRCGVKTLDSNGDGVPCESLCK